jgi:hypothetical protein
MDINGTNTQTEIPLRYSPPPSSSLPSHFSITHLHSGRVKELFSLRIEPQQSTSQPNNNLNSSPSLSLPTNTDRHKHTNTLAGPRAYLSCPVLMSLKRLFPLGGCPSLCVCTELAAALSCPADDSLVYRCRVSVYRILLFLFNDFFFFFIQS